MTLHIRDERPEDIEPIDRLTRAAFANQPYSSKTEQHIVRALRHAGALTLSLVAQRGSEPVIGHIAFSLVTISDGSTGLYGLGPVSVAPDEQGRGLGARLVNAGLERLRALGARGCVLLGDPAYYGRFGFKADPALVLPGVPPEYFQTLNFSGAAARGEVRYHAGFDVSVDR